MEKKFIVLFEKSEGYDEYTFLHNHVFYSEESVKKFVFGLDKNGKFRKKNFSKLARCYEIYENGFIQFRKDLSTYLDYY
jgi:hypothetical protein